jgi:hypothetical protein
MSVPAMLEPLKTEGSSKFIQIFDTEPPPPLAECKSSILPSTGHILHRQARHLSKGSSDDNDQSLVQPILVACR